MKMVVSVDDVLTRLGMKEVEDVADSIESGLKSAHLRYQSMLNTIFDRATGIEDTFYLDSEWFPTQLKGYARLKLGRRFVDASTIQVVSWENGQPDVITTLAADKWKIDASKGVLYVVEDYMDTYIKVTYAAGFDGTNKAPEWLIEAILCYVPTVLNNQQVTNRNEQVEPLAKQAKLIGDELVEPYLILPAFCFKPLVHNV